ncbi:MAG TPA: tyrosine-type recombinase/integrase [Sphingobium sp.]|nr:tyrosine-type recombinase/integrase [Sphingobium sp.]
MYDGVGQRKYLTAKERVSFLYAAAQRGETVHSFCWMLATTGCRISEALALSRQSIDFESGHVIVECLKKRGKKIFRTIPLPPELLNLLRALLSVGVLPRERLWPWSRMTGYRRVREVMVSAGIVGPHATPKGLRHAFGVCAIQSNVPLNLIQRWLGHADIKTTAIYTSAMGPEEREFASRTWKFSMNRSRNPRSTRAKHAALGSGAIRHTPALALEERQGNRVAYDDMMLLKLAALLDDRFVGGSQGLSTEDELKPRRLVA